MILLVTHSRDFACDLLVDVLRSRNVRHLRLDLDQLVHDQVVLDPLGPLLTQILPDGEVRKVDSPRAILFRAPTHLRESSGHRYGAEELLQRHQWAAFARSLMVFREAKWINHPAHTFAAENKPLQLAIAAATGFQVPVTAITNHSPDLLSGARRIAVKALDSFFVRWQGEDLFFYTTGLSPEDLTPDVSNAMPFIAQEYLDAKVDIRVTVVGDRCFFAETSSIVQGDWRLQKDRVAFRPFHGSDHLRSLCVALLRALSLYYGAIDLVRIGGTYLFLEINPTGEWAWLDGVFDGEIAKAIVDELTGDKCP